MSFRRTQRWMSVAAGVLLSAQALAFPVKVHEENSALAPGFLAALQSHAGVTGSFASSASTDLWLKAFKRANIDPDFLSRKFRHRNMIALSKGARGSFDRYLTLRIEEPKYAVPSVRFRASDPIALHMTKFTVLDEYDDVTNDDIYVYTVTTYGDKVWGRVSDVYKGLDEGDSFFFGATDRGVFGPKGEAMPINNHLIVDVGIIESDGDDIKQLKQLSDVIVDLAVVALAIENPGAGAAAAKARQEVKNLLHLVAELDSDDRLVTDSMYFEPQDIATQMTGTSFHEFHKDYEKTFTFSHFHYDMMWRFLRP